MVPLASLTRHATTGRLTVEYDETETDVDAIAARVEAVGYTVPDDGGETLRFSVPEMDVLPALGRSKARSVGSTASKRRNTLRPPGRSMSRTTGTRRRKETSWPLSRVPATRSRRRRTRTTRGPVSRTKTLALDQSRALKTWASGVFVAFGLLFEFLLRGANAQVGSVLGSPLHVADILFLIAVATGGQEILRGGYYSLKNRSLDIDLLMSIAILGALTAVWPSARRGSRPRRSRPLQHRGTARAVLDGPRAELACGTDGPLARRATVNVTEPRRSCLSMTYRSAMSSSSGPARRFRWMVRSSTASAVNESITGESVPVEKTEGDEVVARLSTKRGISKSGRRRRRATSRSRDRSRWSKTPRREDRARAVRRPVRGVLHAGRRRLRRSCDAVVSRRIRVAWSTAVVHGRRSWCLPVPAHSLFRRPCRSSQVSPAPTRTAYSSRTGTTSKRWVTSTWSPSTRRGR